MMQYCDKCRREYPAEQEKCPVCGARLEDRLAEEEQASRENEEFTVISTLLL